MIAASAMLLFAAVLTSAGEIALPTPVPEDPRLSDPAIIGTVKTGALLGRPDAAMIGARPKKPSAFRLVAVPAGCVMIGGATWSALSAHTGDSATPALEMGAGYAGSWAAAMGAGVAMYVVKRDMFERKPGRILEGALLPTLVIGATIPVAAGAATWFASDLLEGTPRHPDDVFYGAMAGALAGEIVWGASSWYFRTPNAVGPVTLAFVPIGAGAALGARLARGPSGRDKPLVRTPFQVVVRF